MNSRKIHGFTLVEMVIVITITGILAATLTIFLKPAIDSYFATQRRATLTDMADTALRKMGRDIRSAVPNSIRWPGSQCIELLPTSTGGRYRMASDTVNDVPPLPCTPSATCSSPLNIAQPVTQFDVLNYMSVTPAANDWVVIDNQNTNDVYAGTTNRAQISGIAVPPAIPATAGLYRITLSSSTQFPSGYSAGRFVIVPNNGGGANLVSVAYVCSGAGVDASGNGTGTLYRITQTASSTYPASCPASGGFVVATNIKTCNLIYNASQDGTQQSALVWMQLEIQQANEDVSLAYGVHVDNVP